MRLTKLRYTKRSHATLMYVAIKFSADLLVSDAGQAKDLLIIQFVGETGRL